MGRYRISTTAKPTKSGVFEQNQKRAPEWRWVILAVFLKKWIVSLVICYSEYILHIIGYQIAKFDCAGVLVSRDIGLQPSPSQRVLVNAFGLGVMTSQNMNCRGSLPPTDCVSLYKTYIGCILHNLSFNDANVGGQYSLLWVDITVQPCENGVYTRNRAPAWRRMTPSEIDLSPYLCFD